MNAAKNHSYSLRLNSLPFLFLFRLNRSQVNRSLAQRVPVMYPKQSILNAFCESFRVLFSNRLPGLDHETRKLRSVRPSCRRWMHRGPIDADTVAFNDYAHP